MHNLKGGILALNIANVDFTQKHKPQKSLEAPQTHINLTPAC